MGRLLTRARAKTQLSLGSLVKSQSALIVHRPEGFELGNSVVDCCHHVVVAVLADVLGVLRDPLPGIVLVALIVLAQWGSFRVDHHEVGKATYQPTACSSGRLAGGAQIG